MKTLITAVALVTLIATPVLAQTARHTGKNARAQTQQTHPINRGSNSVYVDGKYVGSDPDPFIRMQLMNDPQQGGNDSGGGGE